MWQTQWSGILDQVGNATTLSGPKNCGMFKAQDYCYKNENCFIFKFFGVRWHHLHKTVIQQSSSVFWQLSSKAVWGILFPVVINFLVPVELITLFLSVVTSHIHPFLTFASSSWNLLSTRICDTFPFFVRIQYSFPCKNTGKNHNH